MARIFAFFSFLFSFIFAIIFQEEKIEKKYTIKFAKCSNIKCNSIFLFNPHENHYDTWILCPVCREKLNDCHVIQCNSCQSVVNFMECEPSENPVVFSVEKCFYCSGTNKYEDSYLPIFFTERYM